MMVGPSANSTGVVAGAAASASPGATPPTRDGAAPASEPRPADAAIATDVTGRARAAAVTAGADGLSERPPPAADRDHPTSAAAARATPSAGCEMVGGGVVGPPTSAGVTGGADCEPPGGGPPGGPGGPGSGTFCGRKRCFGPPVSTSTGGGG